MMERRFKPDQEQGRTQRAEQARRFRRNQVFGVLIAAVLVIVWTLLRTNPAWIFPKGWWRF
jgi:t-SNARE complex subunit (syntaxin)